jgi:class 3 adenylate cyclase
VADEELRPEAGQPRKAAEWLTAVLIAERRGELLTAFDLAERGLDEHPGEVALRFHAVLALARTGSTTQAIRRFAQLDLAAVNSEDTASLEARLAKDQALMATGAERRRLARDASVAYRRIRDRTGGFFPAINAATLSLVSGDHDEARVLARVALELVIRSGDAGYFSAATEAEGLLLLGDAPGARTALRRAGALAGDDFGALATTRRQLRLICDLTETDPELLSPLAGPAVAHFCGHRIAPAGASGRFLSEDEKAVTALVAEAVARWPTGIAYGSLASGGDILWTEALVASDCELHIVLPFSLDEFIRTSVADAGDQWVARFQRCLEAATSVTFATDDEYLDDDVLYGYNSQLAMGLALLRARYLDAEVHQFALWDGNDDAGEVGTAFDVRSWRQTGHHCVVVDPGPGSLPVHHLTRESIPARRSATASGPSRVVRSMMMGDIRGYSKLSEEQLVTFSRVVLGSFADVLSRYDDHIEYRNTWGDALFVVFSDPTAAARCGLDLRDVMTSMSFEEAGLPGHLGIRLSGHIGPIFPMWDPVMQKQSFFGAHIVRAARMEPVTPPGAVLVTEPFAAALELSGSLDLGCEYVGHVPAAKDYGRLRMYSLERRHP